MKYLIVPFLVLAFSPFAFARQPASCAEWRQADFAANMYRQAAVATGENGNVVLSPWGVANLFALLQTGARGDTARGMASALQLGGAEPPAPDETAATFRKAHTALASAADEDVSLELSVSDSLWLAPGFDVANEFVARARHAFDAEVRTTKMGAKGRKAINAFVAEKTHGRIPNLFGPPILDDPLTRLVAVDTIYFKAKWKNPFEKCSTYDQIFHAPGGDVKVPFLHDMRTVSIFNLPECAVLCLPYRYDLAEMLVLLPSPSNTLADVEAKFSGSWLDRFAANRWTGKATLALPKFDFSSEHDLTKALTVMGMGAAFDPVRADFSGIAPKLFVSAAIQKANITVDEVGTEAAAATFAPMEEACIEEPPRLFVADHPFLFLIRETRTGLILFVGRVMKPVPPQVNASGKNLK